MHRSANAAEDCGVSTGPIVDPNKVMNRNTQNSFKTLSMLSCALLSILSFAIAVVSQQLSVKSQFRTGDFPLVAGGKAATIIVSTDDFKVAQITAMDLASDVEKVTAKKPVVLTEAKEHIEHAVIIGTLGKSSLIDTLVKKLDVSDIRGKWESYIIATVERPLPNIKSA